MSDLLAPGEFSLADKLQPDEYLQGRTTALQRLHRLDPRLAAEIISYSWPHPAGRTWTDEELRERLGTQAKLRRVAVKTAERYLGKFAESFVDTYMPSMGAAFDAFRIERMRQQAIADAENVRKYPAMHFTQPMMASYATGGGPNVSTPSGATHHHRHRHHTG